MNNWLTSRRSIASDTKNAVAATVLLRQRNSICHRRSEDRNRESIDAVSLSGSNRSAYDKRVGRFIYVGRKKLCDWSSDFVGNSRETVYWQRDKCRALLAKIGTGNDASTRWRRVGEIYRRDLFFYFLLPSLFFSLPRALWLAARFAESLRRKCDAPPHESGI